MGITIKVNKVKTVSLPKTSMTKTTVSPKGLASRHKPITKIYFHNPSSDRQNF